MEMDEEEEESETELYWNGSWAQTFAHMHRHIQMSACRHVGLPELVSLSWNGSPVDLSPGLVGVVGVCGTCNALCK